MQKKNLFGILILIAYFASCNQIHKTHYENGWYHILSQQKDSIAKESIVTVKDFVSLRMDSDENGTCVIVGQISKHKLKKWAKETEKAIGKHIAFVLDDTVITNPKVNARIENGVFQISLPHGYDLKNIYNSKEVHYELRGRHYFALAFGNISGGYEVRNAYYKGCLNNKDISLIRHLTEETQENVCVFEGFMDFLSYMTLKLAGDRTVCLAIPCDYLVMNSVNNLKKTLARLQEYSVIHCYLDNDLAGQRTTETIAGMYDGRVSDESCHYAEYKDLNDYLRGKKR